MQAQILLNHGNSPYPRCRLEGINAAAELQTPRQRVDSVANVRSDGSKTSSSLDTYVASTPIRTIHPRRRQHVPYCNLAPSLSLTAACLNEYRFHNLNYRIVSSPSCLINGFLSTFPQPVAFTTLLSLCPF